MDRAAYIQADRKHITAGSACVITSHGTRVIRSQPSAPSAGDRRPGQQMSDVFLKNLVLWYTDRVQEAFGFEVLVNLR